MQDIKDKLNTGADFAKNKFSEITEYLKSNPRIASMLLAGGGAGLIGGGLTASTPEREGESKAERRWRIIRNALIAGGAGAGAVGLATEGYNRLENALPVESKHPVEEVLTSPKTRVAGAIGGAALGYGHGYKRDIKYVDHDITNMHAGKEGFKKMGPLPDSAEGRYINAKNKGVPLNYRTNLEKMVNSLTSESPKIRKKLGDAVSSPSAIGALEKLTGSTQNAANTAGKLLKGITHATSSSPTAHKYIMNVLGRTRAGQTARALGAVGLMAPEIAGGVKDLGGYLVSDY